MRWRRDEPGERYSGELLVLFWTQGHRSGRCSPRDERERHFLLSSARYLGFNEVEYADAGQLDMEGTIHKVIEVWIFRFGQIDGNVSRRATRHASREPLTSTPASTPISTTSSSSLALAALFDTNSTTSIDYGCRKHCFWRGARNIECRMLMGANFTISIHRH